MKKFKQFLVPAVIILMGAGAAFATNAAKDSDSDLVTGYYTHSSTGSQCIAAEKKCSRSGTNICTWNDITGSHQLFELSETGCVDVLFEPMP